MAKRVRRNHPSTSQSTMAFMDVGGEKTLVELTRQNEAAFHSLFDNMLNGIAYCRMIFENGTPIDFIYLGVNRAFETLTGLRGAVGKRASDLIPGIRDSDPELMEIYGRVATTGTPERFEFFLKALEEWFLLSVYCPEPEYFVAVFDLITERKLAEQDQNVAAAAFDAQEGIMITDATGVIVRVNKALTDITGYSADELLGQSPRILSSGRHDAAFYADMWVALRQSGSWQGEIWDRRKNGDVYPKWLSITAVRGKDGTVTHYVATQTDISDRKASEAQIKNLAFYDPLTRLANRNLLSDRVQKAMAASIRNGREGALLFIDLDHFKTLNDTLGHSKGDMLLLEVARRVAACIREADTVARFGGDEFVVLLEDLDENPENAAAQAKIVGEKILTDLGQPYMIAGHEYRSTTSIGITLFGDQRGSLDDLLKQADIAMYQAKAAGRSTLRFFDPNLQAVVQARAALEADLRQGIANGQFFLHYQPQTEGGRIIGAEALIRWRHPQRGIVSPAEFIPLAEETGLILPLGHWVLETACAQVAAWATHAELADITVAVNVSARQFHQADFVERVLSVLARTKADPHRLKLELTESMLVDNVEDVITKMTTLKAYGLRFSLDDFGTGYSSLAYLKRLPLSQLKIDRSFIMDVLTDFNDAVIARTIIALGQSLGLTVIAEGVETAEQQEFLASHGCYTYQGYLFGRPVLAEEFEGMLNTCVPA